jgi:hypothetical protein
MLVVPVGFEVNNATAATVTRCPARPGNSSRRAADKGAPRQPVPSVLTMILSRAQRATRCCQCRTLPWSPPQAELDPNKNPNTTSVAGTESGKSAHPPHATAEHRGRAVRRPVPRCAGHRGGPAARAVGDPRPRQRAAYRQFRCISDGQLYDRAMASGKAGWRGYQELFASLAA